MRFIKEYFIRFCLIALVIIGVQIPNFINQYTQRISAHLSEAQDNFRGFQKTADHFFNGDVSLLIEKHNTSQDSVFQDEAKTIQRIFDRIESYKIELVKLNVGLLGQIGHILLESNIEILDETYDEYIPTIPLTSEAIICGVFFGFIGVGIIELLFFLVFKKRKSIKSPL